MDFVPLFVQFLVLIGSAALFVRVGGRLFARTTIQWPYCFKYAAIVALLFLPIPFLLTFVGASASFGGLLVLAAQTVVGAVYLGPRVIKESGQSLGPIKGAMVGVGAAFLWLGVSAILLLVAGMLGLVRG